MVHPEQLRRLQFLARQVARDDAEDLVQDRLLEHLERGTEIQTDAYERRALWFKHSDRLRAGRRRREREGRQPPQAELTADDRVELKFVLDRLDAFDRTVLVERYVHGKTAEEVAAQLDISAAAVRKRTSRLVRRLRSSLQPTPILPFPFPRWLTVGAAALACVALGFGLSRSRCSAASEVSSVHEGMPSGSTMPGDRVGAVGDDRREAAIGVPDAPPPVEPPPKHELALGARHLIRSYSSSYAALREESQASFEVCLMEHNEDDTRERNEGQTIFDVSLTEDRGTLFAEDVSTAFDQATARELVECVREGLLTIELEPGEGARPSAVRVVLRDNSMFVTGRIDLGGLPDDLREPAFIGLLGRYLGESEPVPADATEPVAAFVAAFEDGVIEAGELDESAISGLRELAATQR